ncbi:hypothetical protein A5634_07630 [Mycobacterium asiaticum]|uniref:Uncharacterized protein n=1 Tax=Mycobacterium asiaticum TaxID=1790 RepID=A0A1A3NK84_MYCAS|nr:hypothetical protein A5634_07630 [Mycobacterium asiaticum]
MLGHTDKSPRAEPHRENRVPKQRPGLARGTSRPREARGKKEVAASRTGLRETRSKVAAWFGLRNEQVARGSAEDEAAREPNRTAKTASQNSSLVRLAERQDDRLAG